MVIDYLKTEWKLYSLEYKSISNVRLLILYPSYIFMLIYCRNIFVADGTDTELHWNIRALNQYQM